MVKKSEMKTYRITNCSFDDSLLKYEAMGKCFVDGKWEMTPDGIMAKETVRVVDTVLRNWWNNTICTLSRNDEKYLKNAIKIGRFRKATKKEIEDDFYITVNVA